jgi:hypothetical protein
MENRQVTFANSVRLLGLVAALLLWAMSASAGTLTVTENGVWGAGVPTTAWSSPDESWSYSFQISSTPTVSNVTETPYGAFFDVAYSDFTYTLNGAVVSAALPEITWYSAGYGGLFNLNWPDFVPSFEPEGDQAYTGSENDPTIVPGTYDLGFYSGVFLNGSDDEPVLETLTGDVVIEATPTPTPEPSSFFLLGTGLLGLAALAGRKILL